MAKVGLEYLVYKRLDDPTKRGVLAKAIQADYSVQTNEAKLYADDALAESDKSFRDGTLTLGVDEDNDNIQEDLLGHTIKENGEVVSNGNDNNPYIGIGFICISKKNGAQKFVATWLHKVQFAEPSESNQTKGENTSFSTPTLTGSIMLDDEGNWRSRMAFTTLGAAKAYLNDKAGIIAMCTTPVSSLASGTYTAAQTEGVTLTAGADETIYYTLNGTTPSATNGIEYTEPFDITGTCALKAIAVKEGKSNSNIASYEYIITGSSV